MPPQHETVTVSGGAMEDREIPLQSINNNGGEDTLLLGKKRSSTGLSIPLGKKRSWFTLRYSSTRKCVSSKSALLILLWSFVLGLWNGVALDPDLYLKNFTTVFALAGYGFVAIVMLFFPLAGYLADTKYGRYKTVVRSLFIVLITIPLMIVLSGLITPMVIVDEAIVFLTIFSIGLFIVVVTSYVGLVGFTANVIQFGMDQLHDSPGEERTLFIHWYVWLYFLTIFIGELAWNLGLSRQYYDGNVAQNIIGFCMLGLIPLAILVVLPVTLCLARHRRRWFLIEPGSLNPYKLVYRVTKFARQHKTPVRRSAFTYCEDEVPTGLDLGKEKYGGPFTTEQVEDVKVFYGILEVLFSFGTVFFLDFAVTSVLPFYALYTTASYSSVYLDPHLNVTSSGYLDPHLNVTSSGSLVPRLASNKSSISEYLDPHLNGTQAEHILLNSGLLSPLLIVVCIPVYLCLLRPFISHCVPGMLKRMGLGMLLVVLSLIASFSMDIAAHLENRGTTGMCMFNDFGYSIQPLPQSSFLLIIQLTLSALSHMLIYTAVFEFICSQSPHSMKGLLIGLLYAIKGLYQLLATLLTMPIIAVENTLNIPNYNYSTFYPTISFPISYPISCGFYYYLVNVVLGVIAVLVYVWVAKRYRYRERDEPCNIRRYAEEYYSNPQQEQYYDYD